MLYAGEMSNNHCDTYGAYLRQISRKPLLTNEEEITLGRQVQAYVALKDAKAQLTEELGRGPTLEEWAGATGADPTTIK